MVAGVLVEVSSQNVDRIFEYNVPRDFELSIKVGTRVMVPFGRREIEGFVLEISNSKNTDKELKDIIDIVDYDVVLNNELLELGREVQKSTLSTLISCYQVMLPKALKAKRGKHLTIKYDTFYSLSSDYESVKVTPLQEEIINLVKRNGEVLRKEVVSISASAVSSLVNKGVLKEEKREHYRLDFHSQDSIEKKELTNDQNMVVSEVLNNSGEVFLLYGVTGSGKTEVYMEIIDHYLRLGKSSIVLVPEISLTPQMVERFQKRFGDKIAALHSGLSDGEKYDEWRRIYRGEVSIVIGARSAIFAPLADIGVIIVDEEHSDSYKQSDPNPRYHARDIAIMRGKTHKCSVVLGSATPSLESMARAQKGVYHYLSLPNRVNGRKLPPIKVIDMSKVMKQSNGFFSKELLDSIEDKLKNNEQIILLLNRRGYSSFVLCKNCGYTFKCPNCDISLTYHKSGNILRCHYCGYAEKLHSKCPECGKYSFTNLGAGTQRIEEELAGYFPDSRILRMDYDTTSRKGMHETMISSFQKHEYDILLGTQMVAKGLDFPNVTLVGVINADTTLNIPDFRSSESTFALLSQVAGRSGRSERAGNVIIQTFNPDHYAIISASHHDYSSFYKQEMFIRKQLKYPPYYFLCNIRISGRDSEYLYLEALKIKKSLEKNVLNIIVLGPSSAGVFKINNIYRYNILIKYKRVNNLYEFLYKIIDHYRVTSKLKLDIDFNPSQIF